MYKVNIFVQDIAKLLKSTEIGGTVTHEQIMEITGLDTEKSRHLVGAARDVVMRENRIVFGSIQRVGLRRLDDVGIVEAGVNDMKGIHRRSKKKMRVLACVQEYDKLPEEYKVMRDSALIVFGNVYKQTGSNALETVKEANKSNLAQIAAAKTVEVFG